MEGLFKSFKSIVEDKEGASAVEYAILITLISAVIIFTVGFLGVNTRDAFNQVGPGLTNEVPAGDGDGNNGHGNNPDGVDPDNPGDGGD
jgi:Flp pilus assembly pilin Flp